MFADVDTFCNVVLAALIIGGIVYGAIQVYLFFYHPEVWREMQQRTHERLLQEDRLREQKKMREHEQNMANRRRNQQVAGIAGTILRAFLR
jgi:hypothetical protein